MTPEEIRTFLLLTRRLINAGVQMPNLMEHHDEGLAQITRAPTSITLSR